eukprot:5739267-Amphidinium_carterae.1
MDESRKAFYTRRLTRLTPELQWDKQVYDKLVIPQMYSSMNEDYAEEEHIGKRIIDEFFNKTRLNVKQSAHRLYNNSNNINNNIINKEQRQVPPNLDNAELPSTEHPEHPEDSLPSPSLEQPQAHNLNKQSTTTFILDHPSSNTKSNG